MSESTKEERGAKGAAKFAWGSYQHVAAALGAFSMAVFLGELFDLSWRGILAKAIGVWDEAVRPAVKWLSEALVWPLESLLGWNIEVPLVVRDYFSVGLLLFFSMFRAFRPVLKYSGYAEKVLAKTPVPWSPKLAFLGWLLLSLLGTFLAVVVLWPIVVFTCLAYWIRPSSMNAIQMRWAMGFLYGEQMVFGPEQGSIAEQVLREVPRERQFYYYSLLPLIYLALLLAINYLIL